MAKVEAVLWDVGGVFLPSPFSHIRNHGESIGMDGDELLALVFGPYHEDTDHPWHRLERGEVPLRDARQDLIDLATERGIDIDPLSLLARLARHDDQRDEVVQRAIAIKASGVRTACVTNNVLEFGDAWRAMVPVDELFDVVIDSCKTGFRKPNKAMYETALAALDVAPERTVFLDDFPANVAAAEALGITGIVVGDDRLAAFDRLEKLVWPT